jgi:hypothetical protein
MNTTYTNNNKENMIKVSELTFFDGDENITNMMDVSVGCQSLCETLVDACSARGIAIMYNGEDITYEGMEIACISCFT